MESSPNLYDTETHNQISSTVIYAVAVLPGTLEMSPLAAARSAVLAHLLRSRFLQSGIEGSRAADREQTATDAFPRRSRLGSGRAARAASRAARDEPKCRTTSTIPRRSCGGCCRQSSPADCAERSGTETRFTVVSRSHAAKDRWSEVKRMSSLG